MARFARLVVPGYPHHVTQRGNRRADVFMDDADRRVYLALLQRYAKRRSLDVWAYCLMPNHIHLVAVPQTETALAQALRDVHTAYAVYFNRKVGETGHVWQGRFFSCVLDERHLWAAVRYVEQNPVRSGIVECAEEYPWSSAGAHCGLRKDLVLNGEFLTPVTDWKDWLKEEDEVMSGMLRKSSRTGRPCGSSGFFDALETLLGRGVRPRKRGRKRRADERKN